MAGTELSGNPNGNPNPNIAEEGKNTRFGTEGGADPREAQKLSIEPRAALRYLGAQGIDPDPAKAEEEIKRVLQEHIDHRGHIPACAMSAARILIKSIARPDAQTFNAVAENIEGKLIEKRQELPPPKLLPEDCTSEEAALAAHQQFNK